MTNTKLLQTIVDKVSSVDRKVDSLDNKMDKRFTEVNQRLDTIGTSVAHLEDDAPTIEEFDKLGKRVTKLDHQVADN